LAAREAADVRADVRKYCCLPQQNATGSNLRAAQLAAIMDIFDPGVVSASFKVLRPKASHNRLV
jgi:hypothetical protein